MYSPFFSWPWFTRSSTEHLYTKIPLDFFFWLLEGTGGLSILSRIDPRRSMLLRYGWVFDTAMFGELMRLRFNARSAWTQCNNYAIMSCLLDSQCRRGLLIRIDTDSLNRTKLRCNKIARIHLYINQIGDEYWCMYTSWRRYRPSSDKQYVYCPSTITKPLLCPCDTL